MRYKKLEKLWVSEVLQVTDSLSTGEGKEKQLFCYWRESKKLSVWACL